MDGLFDQNSSDLKKRINEYFISNYLTSSKIDFQDDRMINCVWSLIQKTEQLNRWNVESKRIIQSLEIEVQNKDSNYITLNSRLNQVLNQLEYYQSKADSITARESKEIQPLKSQINELTKMNKKISFQETHLQHEVRKQQQDYRKLQIRLEKALSSKNNAPVIEMKKTKSIVNVSNINSSEKKSCEIDLLGKSIKEKERAIDKLTIENGELSNSLKDFHKKLYDVLTSFELKSIKEVDTPEPIYHLNEDCFKLPYGISQPEIEKCLSGNIQSLKKKLEERKNEKESDMIAQLNQKIDSLTNIVSEQEKLLNFQMLHNSSNTQLLAEANRLSMYDEIRREKERLAEQKDALNHAQVKLLKIAKALDHKNEQRSEKTKSERLKSRRNINENIECN